MTSAEQTLADDKARAEIAKLIAETSKINAEVTKIGQETKWYLLVVGSGFTLAAVAVAKLFL